MEQSAVAGSGRGLICGSILASEFEALGTITIYDPWGQNWTASVV
jgi:hypothetical protein